MSHHFAGAGDVGVPLKSTVSNCDGDRACPTFIYLLPYRYFNLLYYYRPGTLPSPLAPLTTNRHPVECLRHWFSARPANVYNYCFFVSPPALAGESAARYPPLIFFHSIL